MSAASNTPAFFPQRHIAALPKIVPGWEPRAHWRTSGSGHSRLAIILEIYTNEDRQAQRDALGKVSAALGHDDRHEPGRE
jgi:hypothetical protein